MSLLHQKVSAIADGVDAAQIQPSDWNTAHVFNPALTGILADPTGTNSFTGVNTSTQGAFLRRQFNSVTPAYEFAEQKIVDSADYRFSQTPLVALSASIPVLLAMAPLPSGINANSVNKHYLRITDAVAGNETVLITGVSGSSVAFTPTLSHLSGNWSIASATAGIQEAFYSTAPVRIYVSDGMHYAYGTLFLRGIGGNCTILYGDGPIASRYCRHSSFPTGDLIKWEGNVSSGYLIIRDIKLMGTDRTFNNTSGAILNLGTTAPEYLDLSGVEVIDGYQLINYSGNGILRIDNCKLRIEDLYPYAYSHLVYSNGPFLLLTDTFVTDVPKTSAVACVILKRADGGKITNCFMSGYDGIFIDNDAAQIFNFFQVDSNIIDSCYRYGIFVNSGAHNAIFGGLRITNNHLVQNSPYAMSPVSVGIYIANNMRGIIIVGNTIQSWQYSGIVLGTPGVMPYEVTINSNSISNNDGANAGGYGIVVCSAVYYCGISIVGNQLTNVGSTQTPNQDVGLYFTGASGTYYGYTVVGNNFLTNSTYPVFSDATPTFLNFVIFGNNGVTDSFLSVPSGANIATPQLSETIYLTGVVNVTTITPVWGGRRLTLHKYDAGSLTVGGGGNCAGGAVTLAQYGTVQLIYSAPHGAWIVK